MKIFTNFWALIEKYPSWKEKVTSRAKPSQAELKMVQLEPWLEPARLGLITMLHVQWKKCNIYLHFYIAGPMYKNLPLEGSWNWKGVDEIHFYWVSEWHDDCFHLAIIGIHSSALSLVFTFIHTMLYSHVLSDLSCEWNYKCVTAWKCFFSGVYYRNEFWHLGKKPALIFSKWPFFKKIWWSHQPYNKVIS